MVTAIHTLLDGCIDYAGLFPPAELTMETAVANYATYRYAAERWALGRFIVPVAHLPAFVTAQHAIDPTPATPWSLSVLGTGHGADDVAAIRHFNQAHTSAQIDSLELKLPPGATTLPWLDPFPTTLEVYVELPSSDDPEPLLVQLRAAGLRAKIRTGGVTTEGFPPPPDILRFIKRCTSTGTSFKATAGLHHALCGNYRLTYAPASACGHMYGFLNVLLATAFIQAGLDTTTTTHILEEQHLSAFSFDATGVTWGDQRLSNTQLVMARQLLVAFGSCSFTEPMDDLAAMKVL